MSLEHTDRQSSSSRGSPCKESLGQLHADKQHQDEGVQSVCAQQRSMDPILLSRAQTQHLPSALPHDLARPHPWQRGPGTGGTPKHVCLARLERLHWLGHVSCMQHGHIPKDVLYSELATGSRSAGRPVLSYKDVFKRDLKAGNIKKRGESEGGR